MKKIIFALMILLFINGCGFAKEEAPKVYEAECYEFGEGLNIDIPSLSLIDGVVFFSVSEGLDSSEIYRFNPGYGSLRCVIGEHSESDPAMIPKVCCFSNLKDGGLGLLTKEGLNYTLRSFSKSSYKCEEEKALTLDLSAKGRSILPYIVLFPEDKTVIIADDIHCVEKDGYTRKLSLEEGASVMDAVLTSEERIFVVSTGKNVIYEYNTDKNRLDVLEVLGNENIIGISGSRNSSFLLAYTNTDLYKVDPSKKKVEKVLTWADLNILGNEVQCVGETRGGYRCITYNWSGGVATAFAIKEADPEKAKDKPAEIVLAACAPTDFLKKAAREYNLTHSDCKVTIREYRTSDEYICQAEDKNLIIRDILAGKNIDLIDLYGFEIGSPNYCDLIDKKYIEDLTPYFEGSNKLDLDDFLDEAVALFDYNGCIGAVTNLFGLSCYLADKTAVPGGAITVTDLIDYDISHDDFSWPAWYDENMILEACLYDNLDYFVDLDNGTCDFGNEVFGKIMEYAKRYVGADASPKLTRKESIRYFNIDMLTTVAIALRTQLDGNAIICGLPSTDGVFRTEMTAQNGTALAISEKSEHKDLAWDFIEYCLCEYPITESTEGNISTYGIPSRKDFLERYLDFMASEGGPLDKTYYVSDQEKTYTVEVPLNPLTGEERDLIMFYIHSAEPYDLRYLPIVNIISEEVGAFFDGQKSLAEITGIIENRVRLYLNENG